MRTGTAAVLLFAAGAVLCSCVRTPPLAGHGELSQSINDDEKEGWHPYRLSPWRTMRHSGRHGWRGTPFWHGVPLKVPEKGKKSDWTVSRFHVHDAQPKDWCFFVLVVLVGVIALYVFMFQFGTSNGIHIKCLVFWFTLAVLYLTVVNHRQGKEQALMWFTGYMLEINNLIENTFIFHSMARALKVPHSQYRRVMLVVMFTQILFATVCYMGVADWLRHVRALPYFLGIWLIYTSSVLFFTSDQDTFDLSNSCAGRCLQWCLGDRFWPAYDDGNMFLCKQEKTVMTLLGFVICAFALMDCLLQIDVTLTKIEQFPSTYINYSSTVLASVMMPHFFHFAGKLFQRFWTLKYGIAAITFYFGVQFLLLDFIVITSLVNCSVIVTMVGSCIILTPIIDSYRCDTAERMRGFESQTPSQSGGSDCERERPVPPPQEGD
jgi:predicted tellurium resistance membrane protein TerC